MIYCLHPFSYWAVRSFCTFIAGASASFACVLCQSGTYGSVSGETSCLCVLAKPALSLQLKTHFVTLPAGASSTAICIPCLAGTFSTASGVWSCAAPVVFALGHYMDRMSAKTESTEHMHVTIWFATVTLKESVEIQSTQHISSL